MTSSVNAVTGSVGAVTNSAARGRSAVAVLVSGLTAVAVLGPMLGWGYPLRYDLVSVPRPQLNPDALGLGDGLPRAVPLDAVIVTLSHLFPDAWLTQAIVLLTLVAAGTGVFHLVPGSMAGKLAGCFAGVVNPFVLEQLAIGHVPHLVAYAMLPWIALAYRRWSTAGDIRPLGVLGLAVAAGSITPGGGALCLLTLAACVLFLRPARRPVQVLVGAVCLQLPWILTGLTSAGAQGGPSDPALSVDLFSLRSETGWGPVVDALGLSGMWNGESLPTSRTTSLAGLSVLLFIGLGVIGVFALIRSDVDRRFLWAGAAVVIPAFLIAVLPALPGGRALLVAAISDVPALGLLRDGHRWLAPPALAEAVCVGVAVSWLPGRRSWQAAKAVLVSCLIAAVLADMFGGLGGRLRAWRFPTDLTRAAALVNASPDRSNVLVLPWSSFRRYAWVDDGTVLDPAPRMLKDRTIVSHVLIADGRSLPQEGPLAVAVDGYLADGQLSATELSALHVGWVFVERGTPGRAVTLPDWPVALNGSDVQLLRNPQAVTPEPGRDRIPAYLGFAAYGGLIAASLGALVVSLVRRRRPVVHR